MAWPTRSKALALRNPVNLASLTWDNAGGPPSGKVWLVKYLSCWNGYGATKNIIVGHRRSGVIYPALTVAVGSGLATGLNCNLVLEAGDTLEAELLVGGVGNFTYAAYGALLG